LERPFERGDILIHDIHATVVGLDRFKEMPPHFVQGAGLGEGSGVIVTMRHVEQSQLRLRIRSSRATTSSGGPRRSITSRSVFMAQDVGEDSGKHHQPSRLPRCGEARHHRRHGLAPGTERLKAEHCIDVLSVRPLQELPAGVSDFQTASVNLGHLCVRKKADPLQKVWHAALRANALLVLFKHWAKIFVRKPICRLRQ
jgi:hypothetical protein